MTLQYGLPLETVRFDSLNAGMRLLVVGGVHGNEPCGPHAIRRMIAEIESGAVEVVNGSVTFVPVANPAAFKLEQRQVVDDDPRSNLNRNFEKREQPETYEQRLQNELIQVMEQADVLLDLHSSKTNEKPFVFLGPENAPGGIEPFQHALEELAFAQSLGIDRMVWGWLRAYADFVEQQPKYLPPGESAKRKAKRNFGVGTTEYFRSLGGRFGVTAECGLHDDHKGREVAYRAIQGALAHLKISPRPREDRKPFTDAFRLSKIFICADAGDTEKIERASFTTYPKGTVLGTRQRGDDVVAPAAGAVIFLERDAKPGDEWIYFGEVSDRGTSAA